MSVSEKINLLLEAVNQDIERHKKQAKCAMLALEHMNITEEEYKEANLTFGLNQFVVGYLSYIKDTITGSDEKTAQNLICFHAYYQRTKGNLSDGSNISVGQATVKNLLDGYYISFFDV